MEYFISCLKNYATFAGRARRKEFWMFGLINFFIGVVIMVLAGLTGVESISYLSSLWSLVVFIPNLAVASRRLHDTGHSFWWYLIIVVPIIGGLYLLYLLVKDSEPGTNKWGANPKNLDSMLDGAGQKAKLD